MLMDNLIAMNILRSGNIKALDYLDYFRQTGNLFFNVLVFN